MKLGKKHNSKAIIFTLLFLGSSFFAISGAYAASVGQEIDFRVDSTYDWAARKQLTATLRVIGDHAYFYIEDDYWGDLADNERTSFLREIEDLAEQFDTVIYPKEREVFGSEWSPGIDGDERITVLLSRLVDDAAGYINIYDGYKRTEVPYSNEKDMLYLNAIAVFDQNINAFLAHEFQHLITFYQKTKLHDLEEDVWLNEARSEYAATLCGYNEDYTNSYLANRVDMFLDYPSDSLTEWKNNISDYSTVSLFFHYLVDHYGEEIITAMALNDKVGIASINQALADLGYSETFSDIFADWSVANYLNNCNVGSEEKYCYKDKNLTYQRLHTDYSASYSGFPNLIVSRSSAAKDWSPRWYRFRQGGITSTDRDTLKLEFKGLGKEANFRVPYIVKDNTGQTTVQFISLADQEGTAYIPEFTSLNKSVIIVPFNQYKESNFTGDEPLTAFSFTAASIKESSMAISSISPGKGSVNGGFNVSVKGSSLSSIAKVIFGRLTITDFKVVDDQTISFTAPAQAAGKIDVSVVDADGGTAVLTEGFSYTNTSNYPEGSLLRAKGDYRVYIIKGGYKRWIQHSSVFNMYGHLRWQDIIDVEPEELNQYQEAWLIRAAGDRRVWEVNADGTKHWLNMTAQEFSISGRLWNMVYIVNNFERDFYKTGADILYH